MHSKEYYLRLRNKYTPDNIRVIFLLESPPGGKTYFYDADGETREPLFSAMMGYLGHKPTNKQDGIDEFNKRGYLIIDSIYEPVNKIEDEEIKNRKIVMNIPNLINDLDNSIKSTRIKIILIKTNINQIFFGVLKSIGLNIINDKPIPFPLYQWRRVFLSELLKLKIKYHLL